jgi:hypothetical protein
MKIGRLVRKLRLGVELPEDTQLREAIIRNAKLQDPNTNYLCTSACFFIAVAGIERPLVVEDVREKFILGIHRPFITDAELKTLNANEVIASATQVRTIVEAYLKEMGVPLRYADLMFSIPKDQIRWITTAEYQADFAGIVPELQEWLNARCDKRTEVEKRLDDMLDTKIRRGEKFNPDEEIMRRALVEKFQVQLKCEGSLINQVRGDAWNAYPSP